jgi:hypothetical protein
MANHRADPLTPFERLTWFGMVALHRVLDLPRLVQESTGRERARLLDSAFWMACSTLVCIIADWPVYVWLAPALFLVRLLADLSDVHRDIGWRAQTLRALETKPTGAPRTANVRCSRGYTHRFLYGPNGWEEAGPATEEDLITA